MCLCLEVRILAGVVYRVCASFRVLLARVLFVCDVRYEIHFHVLTIDDHMQLKSVTHLS